MTDATGGMAALTSTAAGCRRRRSGRARRGDDRGPRRLVGHPDRRRRPARRPVLAPPVRLGRAGRATRLADIRPLARRARQLPGGGADPLPAGHRGVVPRTRRVRAGLTSLRCTSRRRGPGRSRRALPGRLRPAAADSRLGSPGCDGRGRRSGAAQGSRRRRRPPRGRRRHRAVPASGGDRPRRRRGRGGRHLRGRRAERVAPPSRRHPGCTVQAGRGRRVRRRAACAAASPTGRGPRSSGFTGSDAVEAVTIARVDRQGRPVGGTERKLAVDLVALGWGFTPSLELVLAAGAETRLDVDGSLVAWVDDRQRSSRPGVYVAGEATGVGGARLAVREGELAGLTAAEDAGLPPAPRRTTRLRRAIRRGRDFRPDDAPCASRAARLDGSGSTTTRRSAAARR